MKMSILKKSTLLLTVFALMLGLSSCDVFGVRAKGDLQTLTFDETNFHGLELDVAGKAEVRVGSTFAVEVTCEESAMPYLETKVENGILEIYFTRSVYDLDNLKIVVTAPSWDDFDVDGSGDLEVLDPIEGQLLHLDLSGSGSIRVLEAHFDKADLEVSGSGDLRLSGDVQHLEGEISGSGKIKAFDCLANIADVEVSGSGDAQVNVAEKLNAKVSGSGTVVYKGDPVLNTQISGSGTVKKF